MKNLLFTLALLISFIGFSQGWSQLGENTYGNSTEGKWGDAVSINADGNIIAIGGAFNVQNYELEGRVRILNWDGESWIQTGEDIYEEEDNGLNNHYGFGAQVSLNAVGNRVAISDPYNGANTSSPMGSVQVFEWNGDSWIQLGQDIDGVSCCNSGMSMSMSSDGDTVIIGAPYDQVEEQSGSVRIFNWNGSSWVQLGQTIVGEAPGDQNGYSVSINSAGNLIAVGARYNDNGGENAGSVRIFELLNNEWSQVGENIDGLVEGQVSGQSISLNSTGNIVSIGQIGVDSEGGIKVYNWNESSWTQLGEVIPFNSWTVVMNSNGDRLVTRKNYNGDYYIDGEFVETGGTGGDERGIILIWDFIDGQWIQTIECNIYGSFNNGNSPAFGGMLDINSSGDRIVFGDPAWDSDNSDLFLNEGEAGVFSLGSICSSGMGIEDNILANIYLYPNPTSDLVFIGGVNSELNAVVYDLLGKQVMRKYITKKIDISILEKGVYFVKLSNGINNSVHKIIKN